MTAPEIRALFPCTHELTYLNTATYGPGPQPVMQAVLRSLRDWSAGRGQWSEWERAAETAREHFAALVGASPDCVALLSTMSGAAAQVAHDLAPPEQGRDVLVVGEGEFRSNLYPWMAQERRGFRVHTVPYEQGRLDPGALAAAVDERTALVAVSTVQSSNGYRIDLEPVRAACRAHGARLFLDGTQSVGALETRLDGADYLAAAGYKWLFAPRGTAFLAVHPDHVGDMQPLSPGWKTPEDPYAEYYGPPYDVARGASRADHSLAWHAWVGAAEGLRLVAEVGVEEIERHGRALAQRFRDGLGSIGLEALFDDEETSQIVGVRVPEPREVQRALDGRGVVAAVRHGYLRASFALFNDEGDVDRALEALGAAASGSLTH